MRIEKIEQVFSAAAIDCFSEMGYRQGDGDFSLPDVDTDFESSERQRVKSYTEDRYNHNGKQRVFSAGTYTTLQMKAAIKDVARVMHIPPATVNYMTAILPDKLDFTSLFTFAFENRKIKSFIQENPRVFEAIRTLLFQPRAASVHPSALIITPDTVDGEEVECFDITPIKKVDGILVSEFDGYQLDSCGLLKNDCLATKELSKLKQTMDLCNEHYGTAFSLDKIVMSACDDKKVYDLLKKGCTQNVFQLSSPGMTKFLVSMQPDNINDIIAANALYRPATLENGSAEMYVECKKGLGKPVYNWGTYNALHETFGLITYQEQVAQIVREVGGFSLGDGVRLVKFISKKKTDKIHKMKEKFMEGAKMKGCPKEDMEAIWGQIEACGSYLFNASHATAYALTAYAGAYLKANYPTPFYTVALQWAEEKELPAVMAEMDEVGETKIVAPDINQSEASFHTDYETNEIFWSLTKIKQIGLAASEFIIEERDRRGPFGGILDFIDRIFRYKLKQRQWYDDPGDGKETAKCPVNARHVRHLILAGCFDRVENVQSVTERYGVMRKASERLGFEMTETDFPPSLIGRHYFWSQEQIKVSGLGAVDYKRIFDNSALKPYLKGWPYHTLKDAQDKELDGKKAAVCATAADIEFKAFKSSRTGRMEQFIKINLQQNGDTCTLVAWPEELAAHREKFDICAGRIIIFSGLMRYSGYSGKIEFALTKTSKVEIV